MLASTALVPSGTVASSDQVPLPAAAARHPQRRTAARIQGTSLQQGTCRHVACCASSTEDTKAALRELKLARNGITIDPAYANGSTFLKTIVGFTNPAEISRILDIAMNPNSLFVDNSLRGNRAKNASARSLDVEKDMWPVVDWMLSKSVSKGDVQKIISGHPPVLSYDVATRLEPFWAYMATLGVANVGSAVATRPTLLGLDVDKLTKISDYLKSIETPPEEIIRLMLQSI